VKPQLIEFAKTITGPCIQGFSCLPV